MAALPGCGVFGCLAVLGIGIGAALGVLYVAAPEAPGEEGPAPTPIASTTGDEEVQGPASEPSSDRLRLTFRFRDADERPREVRCEIRRTDLEDAEARYGVAKAQMTRELNRTLADYLRQNAVARGVDPYFELEVYGEGSFRWTYQNPDRSDAETAARLEGFDAWLQRDAISSFESLADRRYREHGLRLDGDTLKVDYEAQIQAATRPLEDCFRALRRLEDRSSRSPAGLFLSFFQDLRYELPPEVDDQARETLGFRVPAAVLAQGGGDCDSKAAAFCALWRQLPARVLLVLVPEHALVAIEGKPGPGQASIRLGNRYYILCEVAGPGRFPPGRTDSSGSFEYVLIEPSGPAS